MSNIKNEESKRVLKIVNTRAEEVFRELSAVDVNGHTETKIVSGSSLTYLSWPFAWAEVKNRYPDASYEVVKNENGLPFFHDPATGYMVYTRVTIEGITHEMWLPVMDNANKAMRSEPYEYQTKYGKKRVEAATMYDINRSIMRCLVKNLAMFGLGLYIYAGEDLPLTETKATTATQDDARTEKAKYIMNVLPAPLLKKALERYGAQSISDLTDEQLDEVSAAAMRYRNRE